MKRYEKITRDVILVSTFIMPCIAILGMMWFMIACGFYIFY